MCAIGFIITPDSIHLYSDGYSQNAETGEEQWDYSKIYKHGGEAMLSMGYWEQSFYEKVTSLKGPASEIASKASEMLKAYFDEHELPEGHETQLFVFGFGMDGNPQFYHIDSRNDFDIVAPDLNKIMGPMFAGMALNGVDENAHFLNLVYENYLRNQRLAREDGDTDKSLHEIGLETFKGVIEKYKDRGHFGGEIFSHFIGMLYGPGMESNNGEVLQCKRY